MRWLLLALIAPLLLACPPKDVPDPPAVGASAKDGQKLRQPPAPAVQPEITPDVAPLTIRDDGDAPTAADGEDDTSR